MLEKFQCSWALLNIKCNCVVLFLGQLNWLFIYASKYISIGHHCKIQSEFSDLLEKSRSACSSYIVTILGIIQSLEGTKSRFACDPNNFGSITWFL